MFVLRFVGISFVEQNKIPREEHKYFRSTEQPSNRPEEHLFTHLVSGSLMGVAANVASRFSKYLFSCNNGIIIIQTCSRGLYDDGTKLHHDSNTVPVNTDGFV